MSRDSEFRGTYRVSPNRWGMKAYVDKAFHYLGTTVDRKAGADYVRLVESRYPDQRRRERGSVFYHRGIKRWIARGPRPDRKHHGYFSTQEDAERALQEAMQ